MNFERPADAQNEFLTCLRINLRDPTNWLIRLQLGMSYFYGHDYQMAAETLEQASRTAPNYPEVHFSLAAVLGQLGRDPRSRVLRHATNLVSMHSGPQMPTIVPDGGPKTCEHSLNGLRKAGWQG